MKELLKQDSKLQLARCERLVEKRVEVAVFRRPWARCSERNGKIKMNGGVEALSVLAGIYSSPTLERNLQWSSSCELDERRIHHRRRKARCHWTSGSDSMVTFRFRYFARDGRFAQGGESYATFVRPSSDGRWAGIDTLRSKLPPGERGMWETSHGVLTLNYDDQMYSKFSYYMEGNSLMLSQPGRTNQFWTRG
jgi:hypothetical protein